VNVNTITPIPKCASVSRVARNGRNAEYLSGEEPSLGAKLTAAYVEGVQSNKVAAVVKHFALNSQVSIYIYGYI